MRILANEETGKLFLAIAGIMAFFHALSQIVVWISYGKCSLALFFVFLLMISSVLAACFFYIWKQNKIMEEAVIQINAYLDGDANARIDCDDEGGMYKLFHSVNTLAAVLNAHAAKELGTRESLKNIISDISHQLKTPLAALNIYNSLLQGENEDLPAEVRECAELSERELDRMEMLVQNLLKITKLDAGFIVFEKNIENVSDMMKDIELHFAYKARMEKKEMVLSGENNIVLFCDRDWLIEAISNVVKNAFEHTGSGDVIHIEWKTFMSIVQIVVKDNGCGIHPEDLYHIFKRFYRSRFPRNLQDSGDAKASIDTQGIGLGLPLAKAIVEAHDGTIEVDSVLGSGTVFTMNFLIPTKL